MEMTWRGRIKIHAVTCITDERGPRAVRIKKGIVDVAILDEERCTGQELNHPERNWETGWTISCDSI